MSLSPVPQQDQQRELAAQLNRYAGQKSFKTLGAFHATFARAAAGGDLEAQAAPAGGGQRVVQESDVFKVGVPGSKLLYLLNSARGLQVVSFAKGANAPELVGRVQPTGNYSNTMYSDLDRGRLMVLENTWSQNQTESKSRVVIYDVKNPSQPGIVDTVELDGTIADSRMVGTVLYVATHQNRQSGSPWGQQEYKPTGTVTSLQLAGDKVQKIQSQEVQLPVASGDLINIQTSGSGDATKYYLVAVQSESGWLWWDRQSAVEVIDISSPEGKIQPLMTVYAKGQLIRRSQTMIHSGHLVLASNYIVNRESTTGSRRASIARVAVESFKLPGASPEVIEDDEAQYRVRYMERELKKASGSDEAKEALRERLLADPELGLRGRFVRLANGSLKKLVADSVQTTGDTTGLSASLREVRLQDNLLYVFWVPANNVDPLDVFNLGDLENGVKYEARLQYEGWVERSFPLTYKGRKFIVGLGWIIENLNNETQRRFPQAMILEVKTIQRKVKNDKGEWVIQEGIAAERVQDAQITMKADGHVWANLMASDKEIELRMTGEATGEILFSAYKWEKQSSTEGGQIIRFDLNEAAQGFGAAALEVGPFLAAPQTWLQRLFVNSEINMVNAFSAESLSTFDTANLKNSSVATAVSVLELARNISAYVVVDSQNGPVGLQVIQNGNSWGLGPQSTTVVRAVDPKFADTEKPQVLSEIAIKGNMAAQLKVDGGRGLLVLSSSYEWTQSATTTEYTLSQIRVGGDGKLTVDAKTWKETQERGNSTSHRRVINYQRNEPLLRLPDGRIMISTEFNTQIMEDGKALNPAPLTTAGCPQTSEQREVGLRLLDGQIFYFARQRETGPGLSGVTTDFVYPAKLAGQKVTCAKGVNIPGEPVMWSKDMMVTKDRYSKDTRMVTRKIEGQNGAPDETYQELLTVSGMGFTLVRLAGETATLLDMDESFAAKWGDIEAPHRLAGDSTNLYFLRAEESASGGPMPWFRGGSMRPRANVNSYQMVQLRVERDRLVKQTWGLTELDSEYASLLNLTRAANGEVIAPVSSYKGLRILRWKDNQRPTLATFEVVGVNGVRSAPVTETSGYSYGQVNYTSALNSVEIASGLTGVVQLYLK